MDVHVDNPELARKLSDLAEKSGRAADDLIQDALVGYFEELGILRSSLDARYDELKTGRVQLIDGEKAFDALKPKSEQRRNRTA